MTNTVPTTTVTHPHRLYQALAITGIAVGIFVIVAGASLPFSAHHGCCDSMKAMKDDAMKDD